MEAISSVTSLISTILQGFNAIQLARAFEDDFKLYQTRLAVIQLRLSRWGQATGFTSRQQGETCSKDENSLSSPPPLAINADVEEIEVIFERLLKVLNKARIESEKWKPNDVESGHFPVSEDGDLTPNRFKRLNKRMREIIEKRYQKATTQVEGLKWVLYKKEQCESVTSQLSELLGQLEDFVEPQTNLDELAQEDSDFIGEGLNTFLDVVGGCDPRLEVAAKQALENKARPDNISMSAGINNGLMMGKNMGTISKLIFGNGHTINNK